MRNSKKSLKDFLNAPKVQKLQKEQKTKLKGGTVIDDVDII